MAHHKSAKKRIRQNEKRKELNRFKKVGTRLAIKELKTTTDKDKAVEMLPGVLSKIDRIVKSNIIHKNKAANLKSKLTKFVNNL